MQKQNIIEIKASQLEEIADYKLQIEQYQQLLMKQKDIMITMADRLKEKEENIQHLQEELDTFDKLHQEFKEALNKENLKVQFFEKLLRSNNIEYEEKNRGFITETAELESKASFKQENNRNSQVSLVQIIEIKSKFSMDFLRNLLIKKNLLIMLFMIFQPQMTLNNCRMWRTIYYLYRN